MMYGNNMGSGNWVLSIIGTVIIIGLIAAVVLWLVSSRRSSAQASSGSAGEILDRRLASGEITSEQYDEMRQTLTATASSDTRPASPVSTPG